MRKPAELSPPVADPNAAPGDPSDEALAVLEAYTRAPAEASERTAEALRASLEPYLARAQVCRMRLAGLQAQHQSTLDRLHRLNYTRLQLLLGSGPLAQQLEHAVSEVRTLFGGRADTPSALTILDGMPGKVARLTAKDVRVCPPGDGCVVCTLKATIENYEVHAKRVPAQMDAIHNLKERLRLALDARAPGVDVIMATVDPPVDPRTSLQADTAFTP
jgi:hypothetical protein